MNFYRIYGLCLRHIYLIFGSFPRIIDLIYWPSIQIILWGFISKFFTLNSNYYSDTVGIILTAAILYDFLFRTSISYNIMFLEEIWSRNFTNLFITPLKISEIITALSLTAILRALIGLIPVSLFAIFLFGVSIYKLGFIIIFLLLNLHIFGICLGILVSAGLIRFGPSFENIAWASLFFLAPLGCIYYPLDVLPNWLQYVANSLPLVYIFEEVRNIITHKNFLIKNILCATGLTFFYFIISISIFYIAFSKARKKGSLMNMGE